MKTIATILTATLALAACDLEVGDLNNPGIDQLEENPTPAAVSAACVGLQIGSRRNVAQANGYVAQLGILGREAYNFDQADPRFIEEMLEGDLAQGSPFGGNFWGLPYSNLRLANIVLRAIDRVPEYTDEQRNAIIGFVKTIQALDLYEVTITHDTNGVVIDTDREIDDLAPLVDPDEAYAYILQLLDEGAAALDNAGEEFPFELSSGYAGFDEPMTFRQFNRAVAARVAAFSGDYATVLDALAESFLDATPMNLAELNTGVYHTFSTGSGDQVNNLINPNIFAHPSLRARAAAGDQRLARKVMEVPPDEAGSASGLASDDVFLIYSGPSSSVPIIRNEELILLHAEALIMMDMLAEGVADLNTVRSVSGGLAAYAGAMTQDALIDQLLYERRYSLMFEGGFPWIDARRFDRVDDLLNRDPGVFDHVNVRYPIPLAECNARPNEPRCALGSR